MLNGVIEVNPDALYQADKADYERKAKTPGYYSGLHGIPILLKDNIGNKDKLNVHDCRLFRAAWLCRASGCWRGDQVEECWPEP